MSYTVAVRTLCEFTAKRGDLDLRFTPSPTAREGVAGHAVVTGRRPQGYEREIALSGEYRDLTVRGRADGYDPELNRLEEIKTYRGELELIPENHRSLHWAQVKIYGYLLCQARDLEAVELALVYFDIVDQQESLLLQRYTADDLQKFFVEQCDAFRQWSRQELEHRRARDAALEALRFPHPDFRLGQRALAEQVFRAASTDGYLLAEAPTGIGKTLGTLFPLLKALPRQNIDKVFFLSAKTPGRQLALNAVETLAAGPLRSLELIAREKSCEHPDKACHGDSCPLAKGFYDRLPAARQAAAAQTSLNREQLRSIARSHNVCPYYLGQEMARWSDLVIADYNYYFDLSAGLHALTLTNQWQVALLVDEAHNLVERARAMYSAELDPFAFRALRKKLPKQLTRSFNKVHRAWNALGREAGELDYITQTELPQKLLFALQDVTAAVNDWQAAEPVAMDSDLLDFYFKALHFLRIAERFDGDNFLFDITARTPARGKKGYRLCLRNLVPAGLLQPRFESARTVTLFSATLRPAHYCRDLLGLPEPSKHVTLASPFADHQLQVRVAQHISTRFRDRSQSLTPIAELLARQYQARPGNYLAFFSSYDYLNSALDALKRARPDLPVWAQDRHMDEVARERFLERFTEEGRGIGFAVLGGAFAEGIDLPGDRLIGAFIATLGLPQVNPVNEQLKARMEMLFGEGYNYTYLYPGLGKVIQAAGRVIRSERDQGVLYLIDDRFAQPRVRRLLPDWWNVEIESRAKPDPAVEAVHQPNLL